jgi:hypothetical protein
VKKSSCFPLLVWKPKHVKWCCKFMCSKDKLIIGIVFVMELYSSRFAVVQG